MSDENKKTEGEPVYTVDTVPPPADEDDAYSAPTRVGPMADALVKGMMELAEQKAAANAGREQAPTSSGRPFGAPPAATLPPPSSTGRSGLPRVYEEHEEGVNEAATVLSPLARGPQTEPPIPPPRANAGERPTVDTPLVVSGAPLVPGGSGAPGSMPGGASMPPASIGAPASGPSPLDMPMASRGGFDPSAANPPWGTPRARGLTALAVVVVAILAGSVALFFALR